MKDKKKELLKSYAKLCQKLNRYPTMEEFASHTGFTRNMVKHYYHSMRMVKEEARRQFSEYYKNILDDSIFNEKATKQLKSIVLANQRFVVTTAVVGCKVAMPFLKSIQHYCEKNDAQLLVLIAADPAANTTKYGFVDSAIPKETIVVSDISLNSNLHINTIKLSAKHIDPITGLIRIGHQEGSFIYASPKQRLKYVAAGNDNTHAIMTTGAITVPMYDSDRYMSNRTAHIADYDHVMGAVVIEIQSDKKYHSRQIQADEDGSFIDIGKKYYADKVVECSPVAVVLGDWQSGETDPDVVECWADMCKTLKPVSLLVHDAFNGLSINHHNQNKIIERSFFAEKGLLNLQQEINVLAKDLDRLAKLADEVVIVKSNHDEFLERYLQEGRYVKDPENHGIALELANAYLNGKDPLKHAVEKAGLKNIDKIRWLKRDENFEVANIQLGSHGDHGLNGTKANIKSLEIAYGKAVVGHSHTPEILRGVWVVGTSSYLRVRYNVGPSSWMHTSCLVYANGSRQLINVIDKKWRL
jgi:hypothetical protein